MRGRSGKPYLSACCMYRDDASYLAEWIEFHLLVGFERFFFYDNLSSDEHKEVLAPYLEEGIAVLHEWPESFAHKRQVPAYNDCLLRHRWDSRWIAFFDIDEFLFSPTDRKVSEVLADFERHPAVVVNWAVFGTSGHQERPPGLVIENYLQRTDDPTRNTNFKSIVNPMRTDRCTSPHRFFYTDGVAVDENGRPVDDRKTESVSFSLLRVNHYVTRSEAEKRAKEELWTAAGVPRGEPDFARLDAVLNRERDETILTYVPTVRDALSRRAAGESRAGR